MAELEKAYFQTEQDNTHIAFMYNPDSIKLTFSNKWEGDKLPSGEDDALKFGGASPAKMSFELIFDTTSTGKPVTEYTDKLLKAMEPSSELPGTSEQSNNKRPKYVKFFWGSGLKTPPMMITEASVDFNYFGSNGMALRAKVGLSLTQFRDDGSFAKQNPTSGTPQPHKVHRVQPGETLDRISARYYGDATMWRPLAVANGIEDPLSLRPGSLLSIPDMSSL
jgi:contractile injection system tube protein/LysM domain-containing protein